MRMFRLLKPEEIECRISEIGSNKNGPWMTLLLYKTARTDAKLLDETVTPFRWANDYRVIDGKMYCGIGIREDGGGDWVWKWNVGTESNTEAEKGEASDAMKRAGFVWGIGTELYTAPRIFVNKDAFEAKLNERTGKLACYDKFSVTRIEYGQREEIAGLEIINAKTGKLAFRMGGRAMPDPTEKTAGGASAELRPAPSPQGEDGPGTQMSMPEAETRKCRLCGKNVPIAEINESIRLTKKAICGECRESYIKWKNEQNDKGRI